MSQASHVSRPASPLLPVGRMLEVRFPTFTPRITIRSERELTVEIVSGVNLGFSDTTEYEAVALRDDLVILSWQEHNNSTIVHVLDFTALTAHTAVTPFSGGFMRLTGAIDIKQVDTNDQHR